MKNTKSTISRIVTIAGLALGAFALGAVAQTSTWVPAPTGTPPNCPTGYSGCDAPLNVGLNTQSKLGRLTINADTTNPFVEGLSVFGKAVFNGSVQIKGGSPGAGRVLTSDAVGNAEWNKPSFVFTSPGNSSVSPLLAVGSSYVAHTVGPVDAKGAALNFIKSSNCNNFVLNVFDARINPATNGPTLIGRAWAAAEGDADVNVRDGAGDFMIVPTYNGQIGLQKFSGDPATCAFIMTKVADIY